MAGGSAASADGSPTRNLVTRLATAAVLLPVLLAGVWAGQPWFTALVLVVALGAGWEFTRIAAAAGAGRRALTLAAWVFGGALYIGIPLRYFLELRALPDGVAWVLLALLATFANDTAAYAVGRVLGRHPMVPTISPGKTWEGAAGGLTAAAVTCAVLAVLFGLPDGPWVGFGLGLGLAAQAGDLLESSLKRRAGVKDASGLVPGHGGILDRLDSLVFVAPLVYHYSQWLT